MGASRLERCVWPVLRPGVSLRLTLGVARVGVDRTGGWGLRERPRCSLCERDEDGWATIMSTRSTGRYGVGVVRDVSGDGAPMRSIAEIRSAYGDLGADEDTGARVDVVGELVA